MDLHTAYIAVGSNLGDKIKNCQNGIEALARAPHTRLVGQSPFYRTEPIGFEDQDWFVNGVFCIQTRLEPYELLEQTQAIQINAGRQKSLIRNGPRTLDLDILFFDNCVIHSEDLVIPHPRMHERRFVLQPICDINPEMMHPVLKENMKTLLGKLPENTQQAVKIL